MSLEIPSASPGPARAAARSVSAISFNQVSQVAGSVLFVLFVPRALGAQIYGQVAFCFAFIAIFQMLGELGYQEIFSRYLPEVRRHSGPAGVRAMAWRLSVAKVWAGIALGVAATLAAQWTVPWLEPWSAGLMGLSVAARVWAMAPYSLLLGLGETLKWSVETTWRQAVVTGLILLIVRVPSLTLALAALAAHEVVFLVLGVWWARGWFRPAAPERPPTEAEAPPPGATTASYSTLALLRFGFIFSLANFALVVMFRISPITVEWLTGLHAEVGFFDLALGGLLLVYTFLGQVAYAFVPILTQLHLDRQVDAAEVWIGRFVRYAGLIVALAMGGMWAVAKPAAPLLFGAGFEAAALAIRAIAAGLLPLPIAWAAVIISTVDRAPSRKVRAALLGLVVFLAGAYLLRAQAASGIALAFSAALAAYAAGFGRGALRAVRAGGVPWALSVAASALFAVFWRVQFDSLVIALAAWSGAAAAYALIAAALRVVTLAEVKQTMRALRR